MSFTPATRKKLKARIAICGPAKAGKTFTALRWAMALASAAAGGKGRIAVIDSEHRSASKYIGEKPDGVPFAFDVCEITNFAPTSFMAEILSAGKLNYDVLIIDSLSHAWMGEGGALSIVDQKKQKFTDGWREVTPMHNRLIDSIIRSPCHVIATMRSKMEYVLQTVESNGKTSQVPVKVGMGPVQRQGMEYEFDIVCDVDQSHILTVGESRCSVVDGMKIVKPGSEFIQPVIAWLADGVDTPDGYYTASEDDLQKLADQEKAEKKAKEKAAKDKQPKKTADQLVAEVAARGQEAVAANPGGPGDKGGATTATNGHAAFQTIEQQVQSQLTNGAAGQVAVTNAAGSTTTSTAAATTPSAAPVLTKEQMKPLADFVQQHSINQETVLAPMLAKRGITKIREMSLADMNKLFDELKAMFDPKENSFSESAEFCTAGQKAEIESMYIDLGVSLEKQSEILAKRKVQALRSLTTEQANVIIKNLTQKLIEKRLAVGESAKTGELAKN